MRRFRGIEIFKFDEKVRLNVPEALIEYFLQ